MIPTVVTITHGLLKAPVGTNCGGDLQAAGKGVHAADVRVEEVDGLVAFAPYFGIEVYPPGAMPPCLRMASMLLVVR